MREKECKNCNISYTTGNFHKNKRKPDGLSTMCKKCRSETRKKYNNPVTNRKYNLLKKYRMTEEDYDVLLESQGGVCAICHTTEPKGKHDTWHIDHCHTTGDVRGLLCHKCNIMLGHALDSVLTLRNAALYLEETR